MITHVVHWQVTFCVKHFNDPRILSADVKDLLLQSISVLVQYRDFLIVFENNREAVERMPRSLLSAFDNRSWIPVTNILSRLCKGRGFTSSRSTDSVSSVLFQVGWYDGIYAVYTSELC
jgi:Kip1 ubiquitination-promoting complex protein 1